VGVDCGCFVGGWSELARFPHWHVLLNRNQDYLGRCIIALRRHEEDFLALRPEEREELWTVARLVRETLERRFQPDHFNYQVLGNEVRHVHLHLTPRYKTRREHEGQTFHDEHWGTWPFPSRTTRPQHWLESLAEALRRDLGGA
jgi:diadenosine tetraphosphate (Ap4A) HIT family hydrolase